MAPLGISDKIDSFLIALGKQHHILHPMARKEGVFLQNLLNPDKPNQTWRWLIARRRTQRKARGAKIY